MANHGVASGSSRSTGFEHVLLDEQEGVAKLTLNRPEVLNAMNTAMLDELLAAVEEVAVGEARALLLTGAGRAFCAGADLVGAGMEPADLNDRGLPLERFLNPLISKLRSISIPIVTAVNGVAAGGGCGLALAGDVIITSRSAYFLLPFNRIGLVPDVGATWFLPRLVGRARAMGMMLLGGRVDAEQAMAWGMVWEVVDDRDLMRRAMVLARGLADGPTVAFGLTRALVDGACCVSLEEALRKEREAQREAGRSLDHIEGMDAFRSRRHTSFSGE